MRAVTAPEPGGLDALVLGEHDDPVAGHGEVVIDIVATAVNRADLLQRQGFYPPPEGVTEVLGLECSGRIAEVGEGVDAYAVGDEVCALLGGGGYGEKVAVPVEQVMPVPDGLDLADAGALPEVACTVWSNLFMVAGLREGETLLIHGGTGGIGVMAIQLAKARGVRVITTSGSAEKCQTCRDLGADAAIDYEESDFVEEVKGLTDGRGADVILDVMGGSYLERNVKALATGGRLVVIGMQGGSKGELNLGALLGKRASVAATSLRARRLHGSEADPGKAEICAQVVEHVWPLVTSGAVKVHVHERLGLDQAARAHEILEESSHVGKVVLQP